VNGSALELAVGDEPGAVPRARAQVTSALSSRPAALVEDAKLVVTELVTNALLHGRGPVAVRIVESGPTVRVEVEDADPGMPVLPRHSPETMTGRGLALVARLAASWGAGARGTGKVVWAELVEGDDVTDAAPEFEADVDALLSAYHDDDDAPEQTFTIELGAVPTDLLLEAKSHIDNLVREFTLAAGPEVTLGEEPRLPDELAELVATVVHGWSTARNAIKRQALAAAARGEAEVRLSLTLPASAAVAGERYLAAMEETDRYARNARLLTLETPPVHKVFRSWYVQTLVEALRAKAAGEAAPTAATFPQRLAQALTRLAPLQAQAARLEVLQKTTADLTTAGSVEQVAEAVVRNASEMLGAYNAIVYLIEDSGDLRVAAVDGTIDAAAMRRYDRVPLVAELPAGAAVLSGDTVVCRDRADLVRRFPSLADVYRHELSLLVAPLVVGEHTLGALSLTFGGHARVEEQTQRSFLVTLAALTAQALERATAASAAVQANERLAFLARASLILAGTLDQRTVLEQIARLVVPRMADWCVVQLLADGRLETVAVTHVDPAKIEWAAQMRDRWPTDMTAPTGAPNVVRTGVSELYNDITDDMLVATAVDEEHLRVIRALGMSSVLVVPLTGRAGPLGTLTLIAAGAVRRYDAGDVSFAEDLARRAALAVENASAYREQSGRLTTLTRVADAAQHAILAPPPARIGAVALAARYASAAADALVGGDLYEHVRRPGGVRLLIGDVRGKGLEAVRTATVVLGAFRAAGADLDDLAAVAAQMDRRLRDYLDLEDFVSALLVDVFDDGTFALACCGHPPPLLVSGGRVEALEVAPSVPLGLGALPQVTTGRLRPGDRLLLYTDGILEARDPQRRFLDLMRLVQPLTAGALDDALEAVLDRLRNVVGGQLDDDLALLVAEYAPA
jgi:serine phosphatase RsbU (regulator of sigma subunit)/anti-sigma regulatory factor (Ser/Thr protein kinase)